MFQLNERDKAFISDYGFMKAYGLIDKTICGTPMHMADEMVAQSGEYDSSVDVYSFGVLLWFICNGTGEYPAYAGFMQILGPGGLMFATSSLKMRPEKNNIRDDCWELMSECWDEEPAKRPTIKEIIVSLTKILVTL